MTRRSAGLRQSVLRSNKSQKKGNGWRGNFRDQFKIPKAAGTHVLLTRGNYANPEDLDADGKPQPASYHTCLMHVAKNNNFFMTSRCALDHATATGGTEDDADCLPCLLAHQGDARLGKGGRRKSTYSFNLLHLALYEKTQERDQNNKKRYYDRDYGENIKRGDPVMTWTEVTKPSARKRIMADIDSLLEAGEVRMVAKKYLEVGRGFRDQLATIEDETMKMCMCSGELTPLVFLCEKCEETVGDVEEDDMSEEEIEHFGKERQRCESCGHQGFPVVVPACSDCDDPQALTPFDVVVRMRKRGEGTSTTLIFDEITPLPDYELPNGASLLSWVETDDVDEDGDPIYLPDLDDDGNWKFSEEYDIEKLAINQFDFERVHTPRDNDYVARKMNVHNPFPANRKGGGGGKSSKYANYGRGKEDGNNDKGDGDDDEAPIRKKAGAPKKRKVRRRVRR